MMQSGTSMDDVRCDVAGRGEAKEVKGKSQKMKNMLGFSNGWVKVWGIGALALVAVWLCAGLVMIGYFRLAAKEVELVDDADLRVQAASVPESGGFRARVLSATKQIQCSDEERHLCAVYLMFKDEGAARARGVKDDFEETRYRREIDRILSEHGEGLDELYRLAALPEFWTPPDCERMETLSVQMLTWINALGNLRFVRACERRDLDRAFACVRASCQFFACGRDHVEELTELLVCCGLLHAANRRMVHLAGMNGITPKQLSSFAGLSLEDSSEREIYERVIRHDYANGVNRLLRDKQVMGRQGSGFAVLKKLGMYKSPWWVTIRAFSIIPGFNDSYFPFAYDYERSHQILASVYRTGLKDGDVAASLTSPEGVWNLNWAGKARVRELTPAFRHIREALKRQCFSCRAARVAIAIQRYRQAHGAVFPAELQKLVPTFLDEVPQDPFAPERKLSYDSRSGMIWTVGATGNFDPLSAKVRKRDLSVYCQRCAE